VPLFPGEFVYADGDDSVEVAVRQPPANGVLDAPEDGVPGRVEALGHLAPRQHLRPAREKPDERVGRLHLARRPRHRLHGDAAAPAIDPAHRVDQEHGQSPQGHETEEARVEHVVAGPLPEADGADAARTSSWANVDPERGVCVRALPAYLLVDEAGQRVEPSQDKLDVHRVGRLGLNNLASCTMHPLLATPRRPRPRLTLGAHDTRCPRHSRVSYAHRFCGRAPFV